MRHGNWIQTYTGRKFWPIDPLPEEIFIEDIAHALSNQCRFGGHCLRFYSVAQHSVLVSHYCDPADAAYGLLHDAAEAYLQDICKPIKVLSELSIYRQAESFLMDQICLRFFGTIYEQPLSVTYADKLLLLEEKRQLMSPEPSHWNLSPNINETQIEILIDPLPPKESEIIFLNRFEELFNAH